MSWNISESSQADTSKQSLCTYTPRDWWNNKDSWRLCKEIMWVGPAQQRYQQDVGLDRFWAEDSSNSYKKFSGFHFNEAQNATVSGGTDLTNQCHHYYDVLEDYQEWEQIGSHQEFVDSSAPDGARYVGGNSGKIYTQGYFHAVTEGTLSFIANGDTLVRDGWICLWINGLLFVSDDCDSEKSWTFQVPAGSIVFAKVTLYSGRDTSYSIKGLENGDDWFRWSFTGSAGSSKSGGAYMSVPDYGYVTKQHYVTHTADTSPKYSLPAGRHYSYKGQSFSTRHPGEAIYTFTAIWPGTLTVSYSDTHSDSTVSGNYSDVGVGVFINGTLQDHWNIDNTSVTKTFSLQDGDVVEMKYSHYSEADNLDKTDTAYCICTTGSFSYSYNAQVSSVPFSVNYNVKDLMRFVLFEAAQIISENQSIDYALPIKIDWNDTCVNAFKDLIQKAKIKIDFCSTNYVDSQYIRYWTRSGGVAAYTLPKMNSALEGINICFAAGGNNACENCSNLKYVIFDVNIGMLMNGSYHNFVNTNAYPDIMIRGDISNCDFTDFITNANCPTITIDVKDHNNFTRFASVCDVFCLTSLNLGSRNTLTDFGKYSCPTIDITCGEYNNFSNAFLPGSDCDVITLMVGYNGNNFNNAFNDSKYNTLKIGATDTGAIENTNFTGAFSNCEASSKGEMTVDTSINDLVFGECDTKEMFKNSEVTSAKIWYIGTYENTSSYGVFEDCVKLKVLNTNEPHGDCSHFAKNCYNLETFSGDLFGASKADFAFENCYKIVTSHGRLLEIYNNQKLIDKWTSGENRSTFFNCPYNGTILEEIMSYDEQKAVGFKPEKLMYEALKANINSNDAGYRNIHHEDTPWSEYVSDFITYAKPHTIKAVSHQLDESSAAAYLEVDGKIVQTFGNRGHLIGVYDCKTMSIKYYDWTDTYAYEIKTTSVESIWANALSIAGPTDIVYVLSFDATTRSDSARNSCLSVGGHTEYGTWSATRCAHALIGKVGLGANNGYESINNGGSASTVEAKFTSDGLVCSTWSDSGKNHLYEPDNSFTYEHPREFYKVEVPAEEYWRWKYLLKNMKSLWDSCSFTFTDTNTADFTLSVKTTGADAEMNPNSQLSINYEFKNYSSPDFYWHIGKIENVSDKDISIRKLFISVQNIHCVECDFINIDDISYAFYQCDHFEKVIAKMHGCTKAQYTFAECANIKTIEAVSDTIADSQFMCYDCPELEEYDLTGMTALKDATSMFEKCPSLSTEQFKQNTKLPDCLEIAKRMFAECSITEIEGNWVPRNASSSFQNYTKIRHGVQEKDWENRLEKDGWSFPSHLYSAYQMFEGNPIKKISYLKLNEKADNSWLFQNCSELTTIDFSYLNVDAYDNDKYTGIFDGCSLKKENVIWLPISIGSGFDLSHTGIKYGNNEAPTLFWVDDYWCEVDHSGFVEYQHIRRPAYEKVYKEHYGDILIKFWSHPHVHSAEMRGYNELHDTTVWYDKDSYGHGIYPTSWEDN